MNQSAYDNDLRRQCISLPELCDPQIAGVRRGLESALSDEQLRSIHKIVVTGCGDSLMAARACIPAFNQFAGAFGADFISTTAINAARYMPISPVQAPSTLVIGVSCSGGPARIVELLRRANAKGCMTLAVTNNPDSPAAREAGAALIVNTPPFPNANPGLRNYYASLLGLYFLAARLGEVTGRSNPGATDALAQAVRAYTGAWRPLLEDIDGQMFQTAREWMHFDCFEYIGDHIQFCTAYFGAAKMVEVAGKMTCTEDSENWCHVNYFLKNPSRIGTVAVADVLANNRSRIAETVRQAAGVGRPLLLVTNGRRQDFGAPESVQVCQVPKTPAGFEFLLPLMDYLPLAVLAGYVSALTGEPFFRGGGVWASEGASSIRTSRITVVD